MCLTRKIFNQKPHYSFYLIIHLSLLFFIHPQAQAELEDTSRGSQVNPAEIIIQLGELNAQSQIAISNQQLKLSSGSLLEQARRYAGIAADHINSDNKADAILNWRHTSTMLITFKKIISDAVVGNKLTADQSTSLIQQRDVIQADLTLLIAEADVITLTVPRLIENTTSTPETELDVSQQAQEVDGQQSVEAVDLEKVDESANDEQTNEASEVQSTPDVVSAEAEAEVEAEAVADISQAPANLQQSVKFYVSLAGNDSNPGTVSE
ncbi:MAG: hypothetical protein V3U75_11880, partial [Methylococcaceae bacterium]